MYMWFQAAGRVLEQRYKVFGLTVHKQAYREHKRADALKAAQARFYSTIIDHFLKLLLSAHSEATKERCNMPINFFKQKIINIRSLLFTTVSLLPPTVNPPTVQPLCFFSAAPQEEVEDIIR